MRTAVGTGNEPDLTADLLKAILTATPSRKRDALNVLLGQTQAEVRPGPEPYLRLRDISRILNISACSLWRWKIPGHELGGRRRFRMSEVEAYLKSDAFARHSLELKRQRREQI